MYKKISDTKNLSLQIMYLTLDFHFIELNLTKIIRLKIIVKADSHC